MSRKVLSQGMSMSYTVDGFIFVGTKFRGLNKNDIFLGFGIWGQSISFHNSYRKLPFRGYWNSWIGPSTKTTKIGTPRNLSHPQYFKYLRLKYESLQNLNYLRKYVIKRLLTIWGAIHLWFRQGYRSDFTCYSLKGNEPIFV